MANRHSKRDLTSLLIKKIQIKTTKYSLKCLKKWTRKNMKQLEPYFASGREYTNYNNMPINLANKLRGKDTKNIYTIQFHLCKFQRTDKTNLRPVSSQYYL